VIKVWFLTIDKKMDAVIIAVGHKQFREMSVKEIRGLMGPKPVLVDVRRIVEPAAAEKAGMNYKTL